MKILRISLTNLNSLRGDFDINLEDELFSRSGIFAITGPTGAGKSTILDAITLALYGRAARYGNDKPENMMSRGTGECRAEVLFEVPKGRYRAVWHLKRARSKPDGKLQHPQRFLYDSQGETIAQKSTEVDKAIEELTGLDSDRFFRSVLLAQGDFVKFLKATPDERATLLESLTGTEIYTEISKKAHQETVYRTHALELRENDLASIHRLDSEDRKALIGQIIEYKNTIENNAQQLVKLTDLINKGNHFVKYLEQQNIFKLQLESINKEKALLDPDSIRLALFRQGEPFISELQTLDQNLKTCNAKKSELTKTEQNLLLAKKELRTGFDATCEMIIKSISEFEKAILESCLERTHKLEKFDSLNKWLETHQQDRSLDQDLSHIVEQITSLTHFRNKAKEVITQRDNFLKNLENDQQRLKVLLSEKEVTQTQLKARISELEICHHERLGILQGKTIENIRNEILSLENYLEFLSKKHGFSDALEKNMVLTDEIQININKLEIEFSEAREKTALGEKNLESDSEMIKLLKEKRDESRLIASLHEHRDNLEPGKSCPLCGSKDHPFLANAENSIHGVTDLDKEIKTLETNKSKKESELKKLISLSAKLEEALRNCAENLEKAARNDKLIKAGLNVLIMKHKIAAKYLEYVVVDPSFRSKSERGLSHSKRFANTYFWDREAFGVRKSPFAFKNGTRKPYNVSNSHSIQKEKKNLETILSKIRVLSKREEESSSKKNEIEKNLEKIQHSHELIQEKIAAQEEKIQSVVAQIDAFKTNLLNSERSIRDLEISLLNYLKPYGLSAPHNNEEKKLHKILVERKSTYQENLQLSISLKNELSNLSLNTKELESKCEKLRIHLDQLNKLPILQELEGIESNPKSKIEYLALCATIEDAQEKLEALKTALSVARSVVEECQKEVSKMHESYLELQTKLSQELHSTQFETIDSLRASLLTPYEVQRIQKTQDDLKRRLDYCQGQLSQVETELKNLAASEIPQDEKLKDIQDQYIEMTNHTNKIRGNLAVSESRLQQDEQNHLQYAKLFQEIEGDRKRLLIWQKLANLIGSHDGKSFRKFAQGLSLNLLIKHANNHLTLLNNRYRLKRMMGDELDLEIQDLHQANATRPTASLSGGESFLTSLALALGLSDLAGKNVRIDSLFIDEGFGSLDSDALEIAVQALESLRSKNKTIGVISHIELLKERITTQIVIEKGLGGVSSMSFNQ